MKIVAIVAIVVAIGSVINLVLGSSTPSLDYGMITVAAVLGFALLRKRL